MRVLFTTSFLHESAGLGRLSYQVMTHMKKRPKITNMKTLVDIDGGKYFGGEEVFLNKNSFINFIKNCFIARKAARDFDVVHSIDVWPHGIYAWFAVLGTKKKLFLTGVGTYSVAPLYKPGQTIWMKLAYKRATKTYCISNYTRDRIKDILPLDSIITVHMGLNAWERPGTEKIAEVKKYYNIGEHHPIFISVGAIKERKGQLDSLMGMEKIKKKYPNFLYLVVGDGGDTKYVESMKQFARENGIEKNIRFVTDMQGDDVLAALYCLSTVFLLNSNTDLKHHHFEGFGLVFLEAGQFGVPGVGCKESGIECAVEDGYSGFLVPQKDHQAIGDAIVKLLEEDYEKYSKQAKEFSTRFDWHKTVEEYTKYY